MLDVEYGCGQCSFVADSIDYIQSHVAVVHPKSSSSGAKEEILVHPCTFGEYRAKSRDILEVHVNSLHGNALDGEEETEQGQNQRQFNNNETDDPDQSTVADDTDHHNYVISDQVEECSSEADQKGAERQHLPGTSSNPLPASKNTLPTYSNTLPTSSNTLPTHIKPLPTSTNTLPTSTNTLPTHIKPLPTSTNTLPTSSNTLPTKSATRRSSSRKRTRKFPQPDSESDEWNSDEYNDDDEDDVWSMVDDTDNDPDFKGSGSDAAASDDDDDLDGVQPAVLDEITEQILAECVIPEGGTFRCSKCENSNKRRPYAQVHLESVHFGIKRFECRERNCRYKTTKKSTLKNHVLNVHKDVKRFSCRMCLYRTNRRSDMRNHNSKSHPEAARKRTKLMPVLHNESENVRTTGSVMLDEGKEKAPEGQRMGSKEITSSTMELAEYQELESGEKMMTEQLAGSTESQSIPNDQVIASTDDCNKVVDNNEDEFTDQGQDGVIGSEPTGDYTQSYFPEQQHHTNLPDNPTLADSPEEITEAASNNENEFRIQPGSSVQAENPPQETTLLTQDISNNLTEVVSPEDIIESEDSNTAMEVDNISATQEEIPPLEISAQVSSVPGGIRKVGKEYTCELCDFKCTQKRLFETHLGKAHSIKLFKCPECDQSTSSSRTLKAHIFRVHHLRRSVTCSECGYLADGRDALQRHVEEVHARDGFPAIDVDERAASNEVLGTAANVDNTTIVKVPHHTGKVHSKDDHFKEERQQAANGKLVVLDDSAKIRGASNQSKYDYKTNNSQHSVEQVHARDPHLAINMDEHAANNEVLGTATNVKNTTIAKLQHQTGKVHPSDNHSKEEWQQIVKGKVDECADVSKVHGATDQNNYDYNTIRKERNNSDLTQRAKEMPGDAEIDDDNIVDNIEHFMEVDFKVASDTELDHELASGKSDHKDNGIQYQAQNQRSSYHFKPNSTNKSEAPLSSGLKTSPANHNQLRPAHLKKPTTTPTNTLESASARTLNPAVHTTGWRDYPCPDCDFRTRQRNVLIQHVLKEHGKALFACPMCPFTAVQKGLFDSHFYMAHTAAEMRDHIDNESEGKIRTQQNNVQCKPTLPLNINPNSMNSSVTLTRYSDNESEEKVGTQQQNAQRKPTLSTIINPLLMSSSVTLTRYGDTESEEKVGTQQHNALRKPTSSTVISPNLMSSSEAQARGGSSDRSNSMLPSGITLIKINKCQQCSFTATSPESLAGHVLNVHMASSGKTKNDVARPPGTKSLSARSSPIVRGTGTHFPSTIPLSVVRGPKANSPSIHSPPIVRGTGVHFLSSSSLPMASFAGPHFPSTNSLPIGRGSKVHSPSIHSPAFTAKRSTPNFLKGAPNIIAKGSNLISSSPLVAKVSPPCTKGSTPIMANGSTPIMDNSSISIRAKDSTQIMDKNSSSIMAKDSTQMMYKSSTPIMTKDSTQIMDKSSTPIMTNDSTQIMDNSSNSTHEHTITPPTPLNRSNLYAAKALSITPDSDPRTPAVKKSWKGMVQHLKSPSLSSGVRNPLRNGDKYSCESCEYRTSNKKDLRKHVTTQHSRVTTYECDACPYRTTTKRELSKHNTEHKMLIRTGHKGAFETKAEDVKDNSILMAEVKEGQAVPEMSKDLQADMNRLNNGQVDKDMEKVLFKELNSL